MLLLIVQLAAQNQRVKLVCDGLDDGGTFLGASCSCTRLRSIIEVGDSLSAAELQICYTTLHLFKTALRVDGVLAIARLASLLMAAMRREDHVLLRPFGQGVVALAWEVRGSDGARCSVWVCMLHLIYCRFREDWQIDVHIYKRRSS